jgi:predicted lipid-binding transport protein (Tim44 family)
MATNQRPGINPQAARSHAHGKRFWIFLIAPWLVGVAGGLVAGLIFGVGMAVGIGSGLAIALGLNFVWVVIVFEIDDGDVDDRAHEAVIREDAEHEAR